MAPENDAVQVEVETPPATPVETPPAEPPVETPPPAAAESASVDERDAELERLRAALKATNKENADRRKKLERFEAEEAERQQAAMSDLDKANKRADDAEQRAAAAEAKARDTLIRAAFVAEAAKIQAAHPEDVYRLADLKEVTVGDDGTVLGVAEAVKALADAGRIPLSNVKPQAPKLDGGAGSQDRPSKQSVTLTQAEIETARRMGITPERYAAQKLALQQEEALA